MSANANACGPYTVTESTSKLTTPIDATNYTTVTLEWDQDWEIFNQYDDAYVYISTDSGSTYTTLVSWEGISAPDQHESFDISNLVAGHTFQIIFEVIQPGRDYWWAVDNVQVMGQYVTPVEFTAFNANTNNDKVVLNWSTATETNNKGFEVQRKSGNGNFDKVGFIQGSGTTTNPQHYSFTDSKIANGKYSYRIKQTDFDGKFRYSKEVEVYVNVPLQFSLKQNYPNPFNPTTTIEYSIPKNENVNLTVYNLLGQKVKNLVNRNEKAGEYNIKFNASNLASGIYYYRLKSGNYVKTKKMILLK